MFSRCLKTCSIHFIFTTSPQKRGRKLKYTPIYASNAVCYQVEAYLVIIKTFRNCTYVIPIHLSNILLIQFRMWPTLCRLKSRKYIGFTSLIHSGNYRLSITDFTYSFSNFAPSMTANLQRSHHSFRWICLLKSMFCKQLSFCQICV